MIPLEIAPSGLMLISQTGWNRASSSPAPVWGFFLLMNRKGVKNGRKNKGKI